MYVIIVGCGRVGSELAKLLSGEGHNVVVVDRNPESFRRLGKKFNGLTMVGNGFDAKLLKEAGIEKANAFCSVTNGDNTNILSSQVAKKIFNVPRVIARIYDPHRAEIYRSLGLDVISGTMLLAAMIRDKLIEQKFSSYLLDTSELGMLEIDVDNNLKAKTVGEVNIPLEFMVVALVKKNKHPIIPDSTVKLDLGDKLIGIVRTANLSKVKKELGIGGE
ncbi:MAG: TrkA family potassium uptake protein [Candidatus Omnitrophica bacterium]|nr:TrkA family potassium uptake protein [Candidatus Omnitrophota bacterium]MDD5355267.1 TrkA family potassium uptake protein [Candidatus Omnitrophota bacterium]